MRSFNIAAAAALVLVPAPAAADTVTDWWEIAHHYNLAGQGGPGPRLPDAERALSRTSLAMFEAVNAIDRRYESYLQLPAGDPKASQDSAAATAAYATLLKHFPANKKMIEDNYAMVMAQIPDGEPKESGRRIGALAAAAASASHGVDAAVAQPPYRPRTRPGEWIHTSIPSLALHWFALKPWAVAFETLAPPPPPPLTSERYARDYDEVRRLGGRDSKERTADQTLIARSRQGYDLSPMVRFIADRPGRRQVDNARLLALYQMAFDDAVQAMVIAKYRNDFWRPVTAIRNGDRDGNDSTTPDADWLPLLPNPNFQEYPCGHCAAVAVETEVLKIAGGLAPDTPVRIAAGRNSDMVIQQVASWAEAVRQVSDSRILGGVHFRFSNEAAEEMGKKAARLVEQSILRPIETEPRR